MPDFSVKEMCLPADEAKIVEEVWNSVSAFSLSLVLDLNFISNKYVT